MFFIPEALQLPLSFLIVTALSPFWIKKLITLYKSLPFTELPQDEIERLRNTARPKYYLILELCFMSLIVGLLLLIFLYVPDLLLRLQKFFFVKDAIYFDTLGVHYVIAFISFAALTFIGGGSIVYFFCTAVSKFLPKGFSDFLLYEQVRGGFPYSLINLAKSFIFIGLFVYFMTSPLVYLSFRDYKAVYPDKIVANAFFIPKDYIYSFSEINEVNVYSRVTHGEKADVFIHIIFNFSDGRMVDFAGLAGYDLSVNEQQVKNLFSKLSEKSIKVNIKQPTQEAIQIINSRYEGREFKKIFYDIFRPNNSI